MSLRFFSRARIWITCLWMPLDNVMVSKILLFQITSALILEVFSTELLPERYLQPQDFNHHPFTDVGIPASLKKALKSANPYVIYPSPHPSIITRKFLETNKIGKYTDQYVNVPKNYAFSYIVKDQHSGDDFSHSQAHNGKATRGQYRVKLPDGRTQIVSYTADHKGYRADVQYEEELTSKPLRKSVFHSLQSVSETSTKIPEILRNSHHNIPVAYVPDDISSANSKPSSQVVYTVTASPSSHLPSSTTAASVQYAAENTRLNVVVNEKFVPYYQPHYVTTTSVPYVQQQLVTTTAAPHYLSQHHVSSTPLHTVEEAAVNTASPAYHQNQFQNYQAVLSTVSPETAVLVTPRPAYNRAISKNEQRASLYRYL